MYKVLKADHLAVVVAVFHRYALVLLEMVVLVAVAQSASFGPAHHGPSHPQIPAIYSPLIPTQIAITQE